MTVPSEKRERPSFTDSKGRTWHPVITVGAIKRWERQSHLAFHQLVFAEDDSVLLQVDNIIGFAWQAIRDEVEDFNKGLPSEERVTFTEFENSFDCGATIADAAAANRTATFLYFPHPEKPVADEDEENERRPTDGETSSS